MDVVKEIPVSDNARFGNWSISNHKAVPFCSDKLQDYLVPNCETVRLQNYTLSLEGKMQQDSTKMKDHNEFRRKTKQDKTGSKG